MKKTITTLTEKKGIGLKLNQTSSQWKLTPTSPRVMRKKISANMVNTRSNKEQKAKKKVTEEVTVPARETNLETPDQSIDVGEKKTTESTPMPNVEEQEKKTIEFSLNNTPETIKDDSQTNRTSFTERIAIMVGMKPEEKE